MRVDGFSFFPVALKNSVGALMENHCGLVSPLTEVTERRNYQISGANCARWQLGCTYTAFKYYSAVRFLRGSISNISIREGGGAV